MARRGRSRSPFSLFSFQDIITCVSGIVILITLALALELSQRTQGSPGGQTRTLVAQLRAAIEEAQAEVDRLERQLANKTDEAQQAGAISVAELQHDLSTITEQLRSLEAELAALHKQEAAAQAEDEKLQGKRFDREKDQVKLAQGEKRIKDLEGQVQQVRQQNKLFYNPRTADGKQVWLVQIEADRLLVAAVGASARPSIFPKRFTWFQATDFEKWLSGHSAAADFFFLLVRPDGIAEFANVRKVLTDRRFTIGFDLIGSQQGAVDPEKGATAP